MSPDNHALVARCFEILIGTNAPCSFRVKAVAAALAGLPESELDWSLRSRYRRLRDDLVLSGVVSDGPTGLAKIDQETAFTLAMKIIDFIWELAERENLDG